MHKLKRNNDARLVSNALVRSMVDTITNKFMQLYAVPNVLKGQVFAAAFHIAFLLSKTSTNDSCYGFCP
nr:hypothetical protein [Tanacetum cinerariifolium]